MTTLSIRFDKSREWALSRSYAVLLVDRLTVRTADVAGAPSDQTLVLAFGVLPNGESEIAGAWPDSPQGNANLVRLFDELKIRGVERIGLVFCTGREICEEQVHKSYPSAKVWTFEREATCMNEALHADGRVRPMGLSVATALTLNAIEAHARGIGAFVSSFLKRQPRLKQADDVSAYVVAAMSRANDLRDAAFVAEAAVRRDAAMASRRVQALRSN